ncbi:DegT/DnrJ/EryC1/StrS family aminotransferase [Balneolales bacterium ANBcel1]|nr:DegT/DnrJ/EryC1/StrS family aminotransferase [Balneolales bacterium ANBcel1]
MIPVTKPFLPPKEEYQAYLDEIWERTWLTNNGPLVKKFEQKMASYLGFNSLIYVSSGTTALQLAIRALDLKGEIITTPFSFVATTNSILWEGCKPVFTDIDPKTLNIDPSQIEESITADTSAILATHVFGNPCDIDAISRIAEKHDLKVIYDAAHCFGTKYKGQSVLNYGDISTISFHATKVFHSIEGGGIVCQNEKLAERVASLRNFGYNTNAEHANPGINGKNSEFHAAMGLCNLKYADQLLSEREHQYLTYVKLLMDLDIQLQEPESGTKINYSYFPILFENEETLLEMIKRLEANGFYPRRYFHPSLSELPYLKKQDTPVSQSVSKRILCLPMFNGLNLQDQKKMCRLLLQKKAHSLYFRFSKVLMKAASL